MKKERMMMNQCDCLHLKMGHCRPVEGASPLRLMWILPCLMEQTRMGVVVILWG